MLFFKEEICAAERFWNPFRQAMDAHGWARDATPRQLLADLTHVHLDAAFISPSDLAGIVEQD